MPLADLPPPPSDAEIKAGRKGSWFIMGVGCVVFAIFFVWSCGRGMYRDYGISRSAVAQFHQRLDGADYGSIYEDTTAGFRSAVSHEDEIKLFENVHRKMGKSGAMTADGFHVNWDNGNVYVDLAVNTQFAEGQAHEDFVWLMDGNHPLLQTYHIEAPQLR